MRQKREDDKQSEVMSCCDEIFGCNLFLIPTGCISTSPRISALSARLQKAIEHKSLVGTVSQIIHQVPSKSDNTCVQRERWRRGREGKNLMTIKSSHPTIAEGNNITHFNAIMMPSISKCMKY